MNKVTTSSPIHETTSLIHQRLTQALNPSELIIHDDSARHQDHAGAKQSGGGHFIVTIASDSFEGKSLVARHRLVYDALHGLIGKEIHAIQIIAKT